MYYCDTISYYNVAIIYFTQKFYYCVTVSYYNMNIRRKIIAAHRKTQWPLKVVTKPSSTLLVTFFFFVIFLPPFLTRQLYNIEKMPTRLHIRLSLHKRTAYWKIACLYVYLHNNLWLQSKKYRFCRNYISSGGL